MLEMLKGSLGCLGDPFLIVMVTLDIAVRLLQRLGHVVLMMFRFLIDDRR